MGWSFRHTVNALFTFIVCAILGVTNAMILKVLYDSPNNTLVNDLMTHFGIGNLSSLMGGVFLLWLFAGALLGVFKS